MKTVDKAATEFDKAFRDHDFGSTVYDIVGGSKVILDFLYSVARYERVSDCLLRAVLWMLLMMVKKLRRQNYKLATFRVRPASEQDELYGVYKISTLFTYEFLLHTDDATLNKVLDETLQEHKRRIMGHAAQLRSLQENNGE